MFGAASVPRAPVKRLRSPPAPRTKPSRRRSTTRVDAALVASSPKNLFRGTTRHTGTPRSRSTTNIEHVHHYISQNERNEIDSFHCFVRISTMRTGRPTIRASIRRGSARKRPSHRHRRLSHRRGFPSHRDRRRPRGEFVAHELARSLLLRCLGRWPPSAGFVALRPHWIRVAVGREVRQTSALALELGRSAARAAQKVLSWLC